MQRNGIAVADRQMSRRRDWSRTSWENRYWVLANPVGSFEEPLGKWKPPSTKRKPLPLRKMHLRFSVGQRVYSKRFGTGTVKAVDPTRTFITVIFGTGNDGDEGARGIYGL